MISDEKRRDEKFYYNSQRRYQALIFLDYISNTSTGNIRNAGSGTEISEELEDVGADDDGYICGSTKPIPYPRSQKDRFIFRLTSSQSKNLSCRNDVGFCGSPLNSSSTSSSSSIISDSLIQHFVNSPEHVIQSYRSELLPSLTQTEKSGSHRKLIKSNQSIHHAFSVLFCLKPVSGTTFRNLNYNRKCTCKNRHLPCVHGSLRDYSLVDYHKLYPDLLSHPSNRESQYRIMKKTPSNQYTVMFKLEEKNSYQKEMFQLQHPRIELPWKKFQKIVQFMEKATTLCKILGSIFECTVRNYQRLMHHLYTKKENYKVAAAALMLLLAKFYLDLRPNEIVQLIDILELSFKVNEKKIFEVELEILFHLQFQLALPV